MTSETYPCCTLGKTNLRLLIFLSKDEIDVGHLLQRFHLGLIVGSSRVLRSNDILYLHPLCLLGFFLDLGSALVDGLDEDWVCGLLDEAGA